MPTSDSYWDGLAGKLRKKHEHYWIETGNGYMCKCGKYVEKWNTE